MQTHEACRVGGGARLGKEVDLADGGHFDRVRLIAADEVKELAHLLTHLRGRNREHAVVRGVCGVCGVRGGARERSWCGACIQGQPRGADAERSHTA
eukprot:1951594-Prymnesium_polylepis.1